VPAIALLFVVVPIIPPVVGENTTLVAVVTPMLGVTNVGDVDPTKFPVPVDPLRDKSTLLIVVII
jgi:hypothetical protein